MTEATVAQNATRLLLRDPYSKRTPVVEADELIVHYEEIQKVKRIMDLGPLGRARVMESTGRVNKSLLRVRGYNSAVERGDRRHLVPEGEMRVEATADGVKKRVRRIRPGEAESLAEIDAKIAEHTATLRLLREERTGMLLEAWKRAHVVTLREVLERIGRNGTSEAARDDEAAR